MSFRKIFFGTAAMSSVSVLRILAQFLVIPVLSRLLSPADYGVVAIAMPFILFTMMFADAGVGRSLVRTSAEEKEVWSTCFWLSAMLGTGLALIIVALAPVAAWGFDEPKLMPIVMALSVVIIAQALSTIPGAKLQQNHKFKTIATIEISSLFTGLASAVAIALMGGGAWALVAQQIVFFLMRMGLTFWRSPFMPMMVFDLKKVREHLIFGRDMIGVTVAGFVSRSVDNLIVGKVLGPSAVGLYSMAFQFARLPVLIVSGPLQFVLYAQLAQMKDNREAIGRTYLLLNRILAIFVFPAMGMIAAAHLPVFEFLLSDKWKASGDLFMLAAPACALQTLTGLSGTIMMVLGRTDLQLRQTAEFVGCWVVGLLCAVWFGIEWAAVAYNVVVFLYTPRLLHFILPLLQCSRMAYLRTLFIPAATTLACVCFYEGLSHSIVTGMWPQLLLGGGLAVGGIAGAALLQYRLLLAEVAQCRISFNA